MSDSNSQIILRRTSSGMPVPEDFELVESPIPQPGDGEVLVRTIYVSLDPYMRGSMSKTETVGQVLVGGVVGEVVESRHPDFHAGQFVCQYVGGYGWQSYGAVPGAELRVLDPGLVPISTALGVVGMPGVTAYFGLLAVGQPVAGETVVVSAAAGAVGAVVGQIAKIKNCRAVGIAGSDEKCNYVVEELGFDAAVNYRAGDLDGAEYNDPLGSLQGTRINRYVQGGLAHMVGMNQGQYQDRHEEALALLAWWVRGGRIAYREDIVAGLEKAPEAFIGMMQGKNFGKLLVRVSPDPTRDA
jgi:NADPH-dependent curcumin reductase CurA